VGCVGAGGKIVRLFSHLNGPTRILGEDMAAKKNHDRVIGETVLDRLVRLLREFNEKTVQGDSEVELRLSPNGAGQLVHSAEDPDEDVVIYDFRNTTELIHFLEMSPIDQLREVRANL
jgi:hypothetical protein